MWSIALASFSILINGTPKGFFTAWSVHTKVILCPPFCSCGDVLSRMVAVAAQSNLIGDFKTAMKPIWITISNLLATCLSFMWLMSKWKISKQSYCVWKLSLAWWLFSSKVSYLDSKPTLTISCSSWISWGVKQVFFLRCIWVFLFLTSGCQPFETQW